MLSLTEENGYKDWNIVNMERKPFQGSDKQDHKVPICLHEHTFIRVYEYSQIRDQISCPKEDIENMLQITHFTLKWYEDYAPL